MAAQNGHTEIVKVLLADQRVAPNQAKTSGATALLVAAQNGHTEIVKVLLADQRVNPNQALTSGATALLVAAQNGHIEVVKVLLANQRTAPNQALTDGTTPLYIAAQNGHIEVVKTLLADQRVDPNQADIKGVSPFSIAAHQGHAEIVKALLAVGVNPNQATILGETPFYHAVFNGHLDVVKALLPFRLETKTIEQLIKAAEIGYPDLIKTLLLEKETLSYLLDKCIKKPRFMQEILRENVVLFKALVDCRDALWTVLRTELKELKGPVDIYTSLFKAIRDSGNEPDNTKHHPLYDVFSGKPSSSPSFFRGQFRDILEEIQSELAATEAQTKLTQ